MSTTPSTTVCRRDFLIAKRRYRDLLEQTNAREKVFFSRALFEDVDRTWAAGTGYINVPDVCGHMVRMSVEEDMKVWNEWRQEFEKEEESNGQKKEGVWKAWKALLNYSTYQTLLSTTDYHYSNGLPLQLSYTFFEYTSTTLPALRQTYQSYRSQWLPHPARTSLITTLQKLASPSYKPITKIVLFGLGSLQATSEVALASDHVQHAALETIVETLREVYNDPHRDFKCVAQDPDYNDLDREFLADLGVTVVEDPKAILEVDEGTLVYTQAPGFPIRQMLADVQWPAALFCNKVKDKVVWEGDDALVADPENEKVLDMVKDCDAFAFPPSPWFSESSVYLRRLPQSSSSS